MPSLVDVIDDGGANAVLAWGVVGLIAFAAVESLLDGRLLWSCFAVVAAAVALLVPLGARDPSVIAAWEVLALLALPLVSRSLGVGTQAATYLAVATLALLIAVEIDSFSSAAMPPRFAVGFVVVTTMAVASLWTIAQFAADSLLGTAWLPGQTRLMWDLIVATVVGIGAGLLFEAYFRRSGETVDHETTDVNPDDRSRH
ncbi:hypothetical protein SAMN06269185_0112 [Natronoarchaeum philippinense]|uniref:Uncharacterized protein n=1 Tax=Natronoarchaeum philippinense TaxID=558529 RepID=A0A285N0C3_NATPI|nr:hypothetical protein [Natronoarchaeum philippinense]SNZ02788.1 hypothetical protein SAMN06269185_0112 [Natronoarchaeum philippinense]